MTGRNTSRSLGHCRPGEAAGRRQSDQGFVAHQTGKESRCKGPPEPEADMEVPVVGGEPVAGRGAEVPRRVAPGTATNHTVIAVTK
jgi:hypothetical protein